MTFFRAWAHEHGRGQYLAYDVTSFSTYAKGITDAEWGYNRDGEKLPQINLGCYYGQQNALPVFYVTYPGSIVDKSHLSYMMAYNDELGIEDTTFVMDKGFCSTANVGYMCAAHLSFILGVEGRHKATRAAIDAVRETIVTMRRRIRSGVYADCVHGLFYGETTDMYIYCDPALAERQRTDLSRTVESQSEILSQLKQLTAKEAKRYATYFDIIRADDGTFSFKRNLDKIDAAARDAGFFCLLTNTVTDADEVLSTYRRRDMIEKNFDELKNHIDMKRLHTHNSNTTEGKLFVAFIALIALSHLSAVLGTLLTDWSMSKDSLITEMEKAKVVFASGGRRLMNPLTKTQKEVLLAFGLSEKDLMTYISP